MRRLLWRILKVVRDLQHAGAEVDAVSRNGLTPLHVASRDGNISHSCVSPVKAGHHSFLLPRMVRRKSESYW